MTMCGSRKDSIRQSRKVHYNVRLKKESNTAIKKKKKRLLQCTAQERVQYGNQEMFNVQCS